MSVAHAIRTVFIGLYNVEIWLVAVRHHFRRDRYGRPYGQKPE